MEEEDERLTNCFMSMVLWKQEQAHVGSGNTRSEGAAVCVAPAARCWKPPLMHSLPNL